jgi:signal transduction histidine kinase
VPKGVDVEPDPVDAAPPRPQWPRAIVGHEQPLDFAVRVLAGIVSIGAVVVMIGWFGHITVLTQLSPHLASMKFVTALSLLLLAVTFYLRGRAVTIGCAVVVIGFAVFTYVEYGFGRNLGLDQLFVHDPSHSTPGRMAQTTAACLILLATARILAVAASNHWVQLVALLALALSGVAFLGYLYGVRGLYKIGPYSTMALHTSIGIILISVAALAAVPGGALERTVRLDTPGAVLARRLIPIAVIALPLIGWGRLLGQTHGLYNVEFAVAMTTVVNAAIILLVTWRAGAGLDRLDAQRRGLVRTLTTRNAELAQGKAELEERVRERTARLLQEESRLAIFAERDRIAADLHDRIIQRLFADGMQLESIAGRVQDATLARRIHAIVDDLDNSIQELRETIFTLKTSSSVQASVRGKFLELTRDSARVLGFTPTIELVGDPDRIPADIAEQLLSVLREALANVTKHAEASAVEVILRVDNGISLRVSDNGKGMPSEPPHSSGVGNIAERARALGGSACWKRAEPHGTVLVWEVPLTVDAR